MLSRAALLACALLVLASPAGAQMQDSAGVAAFAPRETVVLVHGLGRSPLSMWPMKRRLERAGYSVVSWGYSSTTAGIPRLGQALEMELHRLAAERPGSTIHLVGHSLGGILIRWALAHSPPASIGRVVLLAPPNQGSRVADRNAPWLGWLLRPLPELTTDTASTVRRLPSPTQLQLGIIAGSWDAKVRPDEARLEGVDQFVVVPSAHTLIMARRDVQRLTLRFLATGSFAPGGADQEPWPASAGTTPRVLQ